MKIEYDKQADALYLIIQKSKKVAKSKEIEDGVIVDFDRNNKVIGFEVLDLSQRYKNSNVFGFLDVKNIQFIKGRDLVTA
ncbi:MAG: DUF2283 domain-containing protein [Candidatus Magasanikbacteria bacterium]|nr:DUF2283 domain-containing protein [Candidatus Magasanikbacteria bacterium]